MATERTHDPFHQVVSVHLDLPRRLTPGELNRVMKEAGATLHYDVYSFDRDDTVPMWQSESYVDVVLEADGAEVDAQDAVDHAVLEYPLATIGAEYMSRFADTAFDLASRLGADVRLDAQPVDRAALLAHFESLSSELLSEWGEEPGSKSLRMLIEEALHWA